MTMVNFVIVAIGVTVPLFGRLSFYFITYASLLVPWVIANHPSRGLRHAAVFACLALPLLQFVLTVPGGSLSVDNYTFFWQ
jgi:hypothetical protein